MNPEAVSALHDVFDAVTTRYGVSHMTAYMFVAIIEAVMPLAPDYAKSHVIAQLQRMEGRVGKLEFVELMAYLKSACWTTVEEVVRAARDEAHRQRMAPRGFDESNPYVQNAVPSLSVNQELHEQVQLCEDVIVEQQAKIKRLSALLSAAGVDTRVAELQRGLPEAAAPGGGLTSDGGSGSGSAVQSASYPAGRKEDIGGPQTSYSVDAVLYLEDRCQRAERQLAEVSAKLAALGDYTGPNTAVIHEARALAREMKQYEHYAWTRMMRARQVAAAQQQRHHHHQRQEEENQLVQAPLMQQASFTTPRRFSLMPPGITPPHATRSALKARAREEDEDADEGGGGGSRSIAAALGMRSPGHRLATERAAQHAASMSLAKTDTLLPSAAMLSEDAIQQLATFTPLKQRRPASDAARGGGSGGGVSPSLAALPVTPHKLRMSGVYHALSVEKRGEQQFRGGPLIASPTPHPALSARTPVGSLYNMGPGNTSAEEAVAALTSSNPVAFASPHQHHYEGGSRAFDPNFDPTRHRQQQHYPVSPAPSSPAAHFTSVRRNKWQFTHDFFATPSLTR